MCRRAETRCPRLVCVLYPGLVAAAHRVDTTYRRPANRTWLIDTLCPILHRPADSRDFDLGFRRPATGALLLTGRRHAATLLVKLSCVSFGRRMLFLAYEAQQPLPPRLDLLASRERGYRVYN